MDAAQWTGAEHLHLLTKLKFFVEFVVAGCNKFIQDEGISVWTFVRNRTPIPIRVHEHEQSANERQSQTRAHDPRLQRRAAVHVAQVESLR